MKIEFLNFTPDEGQSELAYSIFDSLKSQFKSEKIDIQIKKRGERFHAKAKVGGIYNINTDMTSSDLLVTIESLMIEIESKANQILRRQVIDSHQANISA